MDKRKFDVLTLLERPGLYFAGPQGLDHTSCVELNLSFS